MGSGARRRKQAGTAGYQRPLVAGAAEVWPACLNRAKRVRQDFPGRGAPRPTSADGAPEGLMNPGNDPGDSGQSDAVRLD